jgi:hypothetical protein
MKKLSLIVCLGALILSFQNCSSPEQVVQQQNVEVTFAKIKTMPISEISFFDERRGLRLDVSLNSGVMTALEEMGAGSSTTYCLNESETQELNSILMDSHICEPEPSQAEVCAQGYVTPYASVSIAQTTYNLGERVNLCDPAADLCDDKGEVLRSFVLRTLSRLEDHTCQ